MMPSALFGGKGIQANIGRGGGSAWSAFTHWIIGCCWVTLD
jgi:hypothetical protein